MNDKPPSERPRISGVLYEDRRWYSVDEAIAITAGTECPPVRRPAQLPDIGPSVQFGPEPDHLQRLEVAVRAGRVVLFDRTGRPAQVPDLRDTELKVSREELRKFARTELNIWLDRPSGAEADAARRAAGRYSIHEVSRAMSEQLDWPEFTRRALTEQLAIAVETGGLHAYDPDTELRVPPGKVNRWGALVKANEVDDWFTTQGVSYQIDWAEIVASDVRTMVAVTEVSSAFGYAIRSDAVLAPLSANRSVDERAPRRSIVARTSKSARVYWRVILQENIAAIDAKDSRGRATRQRIIAALVALKDPRIPGKDAFTEGLRWIDEYGSEHVASKKAVSNAIATARRHSGGTA